MASNIKEPFHYRYRNLFVGLFILVPVVLIPVLVVGSLVKDEMFRQWRNLYVCYENVQGLKPGNSVNMRGIRIGHVRSVELDIKGNAVVRLNIGREYAGLFKKNSAARLRQKNLVVGDWEIEISPGDEYAPAVLEGDTIAGECLLNIDQTLGQLASTVASVDSLVHEVRNGSGLLGQLLANDSLMPVAYNLAEKSGHIMNDIEKAIGSANSMISKLAVFGESGRSAADSFMVFAVEAGRLIDETNKTIAKLDTLAMNMQPLPGGADSLVSDIHREVVEADTLLRALKEHWIFRRKIKQMREKN